jgi:predicted GH43/DUF377 family glycosyl hydrolase
MTVDVAAPFQMERYGVIMEPDPENPREAWGVLNPGGARGPDGDYYLFPRIVAEGNFSRIGRARVIYDNDGRPTGVERLGYALEPQEPYEVTRAGGGVEDPRVTYLEPLKIYVMTYTAYVPPFHPRIALAVSRDLVEWTRLGPLRYAVEDGIDLNESGNKDGVIFPDLVRDPRGRPAMAILHRPTYAVHHRVHGGGEITVPPAAAEHLENIWISYAPLEEAYADIGLLTHVSGHRVVMEPKADWESVKLGAGAPPLRLPYGWLLIYHGVTGYQTATEKHVRYSAGAAVLDLADPTVVLYRSPRPILEPLTPRETQGIVPSVVFPTATDLREGGRLDVYYGAADSVTGAAYLTIPAELPTSG